MPISHRPVRVPVAAGTLIAKFGWGTLPWNGGRPRDEYSRRITAGGGDLGRETRRRSVSGRLGEGGVTTPMIPDVSKIPARRFDDSRSTDCGVWVSRERNSSLECCSGCPRYRGDEDVGALVDRDRERGESRSWPGAGAVAWRTDRDEPEGSEGRELVLLSRPRAGAHGSFVFFVFMEGRERGDAGSGCRTDHARHLAWSTTSSA